MTKTSFKTLVCTILLVLVSATSFAQKMTVADKIKLIDADENYQKEYWDAAYVLYHDLHIKYPDNGKISYMAGKVSLILKKYDEALAFLTKASTSKLPKSVKDLDLYLGQAQHKEGMLDEALVNYQSFRSKLKGKEQESHIVNDYIFQVNNAQKLLSMPVNVTIKNMGEAINSEYIESNPSVTADGKVMIFSTCRPENTGGKKDPTVGIYYQDIWMSEKDSVSGEWQDAEIIKGALNTEGHDASPSISPDGNVIFIYRSVNGGDIYYSKKRRNGDWRTPEPIRGKVNTTYFETSACITADKKKLFFVSERQGGVFDKKEDKGQGNGDIWMAKKTGSYEYGDPVNLGPTINTIDDEVSVFIHPDGNTMFFSSNSKYSIGGYDIFKSEFKDGKWGSPINLGYPINTLGDEKQFSLTADGQTAFLVTQREDSYGHFDIYEIDLSNYTLPDLDGTGQKNGITSGTVSIFKGKVLGAIDGLPIETVVKITDDKGHVVDELETSENGEFLVILEGDITYKVSVSEKGFKDFDESVFIPKTPGKTETIVKAIFLEDVD